MKAENTKKVNEIKAFFKTTFNENLQEMQYADDEFVLLIDDAKSIMLSIGFAEQGDGLAVNLLSEVGRAVYICSMIVKKFDLEIYEPYIVDSTGSLQFGKDAYAIRQAYEEKLSKFISLPGIDSLDSIPLEEVGEEIGDPNLSTDPLQTFTPVIGSEEKKIKSVITPLNTGQIIIP